jgi:hypothetical protein
MRDPLHRLHRRARPDFERDFTRHFGSDPPKVEPIAPAPTRDDAAIEREKQMAKLREQRRRGRRATILTPSDYGTTPAPAAQPGLSGTRTTLG